LAEDSGESKRRKGRFLFAKLLFRSNEGHADDSAKLNSGDKPQP
jgi:hypothetical protein